MFELNEDSAKILVVDDNPVNMDFMVELLKDYDVSTTLDGPSALEAVREEKPDLILLDIAMPGMDGFEVCKQLKASEDTRGIPVIFLTASKDDESILRAFAIGGQDYVTKPYRVQEVLVRIRTQLRLKLAMEKLQSLAYYDELTGVANRRKFLLDAKKWLDHARENEKPFFLFALNVDAFNHINDHYGFTVGDEVIKAIVVIIKKSLSVNYMLARIGGSEFFLVFTSVIESEAKLQVERIRELAQKAKFKAIPDLSLKINLGFAQSMPEDKNISDIIGRAHTAMGETH